MIRFHLSLLSLLLVTTLVYAQGDDKKKKKDTIPDGLKALQHPDPKVRYRAVETLGQLGPAAKFAIPELREMLKDKNAVVRVKVCETLWKLEQPPASVILPTLLAAMGDGDAAARAAAPPVIALLGAKAKPAIPALVEALTDKEADVKLAAVAALGDLGPLAKGTVNELLTLSGDRDFFLLEPFVGAALANLGDTVVPTLAKALAHKTADRRRVAAYALGTIGPGALSAAPALAKTLDDKEPAIRKLAARALGNIGAKAKEALPQLETAAGDKDVMVRIEAALACWRVSGDAKHASVLVKALDDDLLDVRGTACQALGLMKGAAKDAVDPVAKLLDERELRIRAIITLGEIGPAAKKTAPTLKKLHTDRDEETSLWSAYATWQITGETKATLEILEKMLGSDQFDKQALALLTDMGPAAKDAIPTLIAVYREEEIPAFRQAVGAAIKKIDPDTAKKLGIR